MGWVAAALALRRVAEEEAPPAAALLVADWAMDWVVKAGLVAVAALRVALQSAGALLEKVPCTR